MSNILAILSVALVLGAAVFYIVKAKKKGIKCIGCPSCGKCNLKENGCSLNN